MSARNRPRFSLDVLLVGVIFLIALLLVYQGIAMVMSHQGPRELTAGTPGGAVAAADQDSVKGLRFRLSEGTPRPEVETTPRPETEPLDTQRVERLLAALPPLPGESEVARAVALTDEIPPPPLTGTTLRAQFPPADELAPPRQPETGPLEVVRYGPEGEVERARELSISFNQPMAPVASHEELATHDVPARLVPTPPQGRWRWVGTQTLVFEVDAGLPMATLYRVEVPAGVRSAAEVELDEALRWTFRTPPPSLVDYHPSAGPVGLQPIIFVAFDQRISPDAVLERISVRSGRTRSIPIQRATRAEIEADPTVKARVERARDDRWIAFRPARPLPRGSRIEVAVGAGTPSAEGPLTTDTAQVFDFRTYGPLEVVRSQCGYGDCLPGTPFGIEFSNPLDEEAVDTSWVTVRPAVPNLRVTASHDRLSISGRTEPRTTYRVTLSADVRDVFGQRLGESPAVSFEVESYPASLTARGGEMVVLAPDSPRELVVKSVNHPELLVWLYRVEPRHWSVFTQGLRRYPAEERYQPPGELIEQTRIVVDAGPDEISETRIDLSAALNNGLGQLIAVVEPVEQPPERWRRQGVVKWVQATGIGLSAIRDAEEVIAWVSDLDGAAPIEGAELRFVGDNRRQRTNAEGLATIALPTSTAQASALVARVGDDVAFLPAEHWGVSLTRDRLAWYVFTDRPLYRPGEEVHFKGWVREIEAGPEGDVRLPKGSASPILWSASDERGNDVAEGRVETNDLLGFDGALRLPEDVALGPVALRFEAEGVSGLADRQHQYSFQVQEYRRPEYEVSVTHDGGPHFVGGAALITARATYFAGGGLADSEVEWRVESRTAHFQPPNWDDFTFGQSPRWPWAFGADDEEIVQEFEGLTDSDGEHHLRVDLLAAEPPVATSLVATATIQDVNRQTWTESTNLLVHPAKLYVGLHSARRFVRAGDPLIVEAIVVTPEGEAVSGREVELQAVRTEWSWLRGDWREEEHDRQECRITSRAQPVSCEFETRRGGAYRIRALVKDDEGRTSLTEFTVWTSGGRGRWRRGEPIELIADRDEYQPGDTAEILVASPFASAEAIMTLRREGVFETQRFRIDGPSHVLRVPILERHTPNLYVTIDLIAAPAADATGGLTPDPDRMASGALNLQVPPRARTLSLKPTPRARELEPGGETIVDLELRDVAGRPVADGDVAVAVVDEAVLALLPRELQDPVASFYPQRGQGAEERHLRELLLLGPRVDTTATEPGAVSGVVLDGESGDPLSGARIYLEGTERATSSGPDGSYSLEGVPAGNYTLIAELIGYGSSEERIAVEPGAALSLDLVLSPELEAVFGMRGVVFEDMAVAAPMAMEAEAVSPVPEAPSIRLRADFAALAVFVGSARTDRNGHAEVPVRVPDNLTRYRVIAVGAGDAKRFGKGESTITAALPLMARPSPPRFLNFGDALELPVVVQNRGVGDVQVDVAVRASNLAFTEAPGQRVTVPGEGRVEVRFPATTVRPGMAYVQVAAVAGAASDAAQVALPVWTPATTEAFATYGQLDRGATAVPVAAPGDAIDEYGGLEVTTSSTALQALTDALLYLTAYPYECAEQLASRILAVAALRDVLTAFEAEGLPEPEVLVAAVDRDIERLQSMQNNDGGFSFWGDPRERSWPYISIHVAHALLRAQAKGFDVPRDMLSRATNYLRNIERHFPSHYSKDVRRTLAAYSLYVRGLGGASDPAEARRIVEGGGLRSLPLEAAGWLLAVLSGQADYEDDAAAIGRFLANRASETAATAQFTTSYGDDDYLVLHSSRRTDAVILDALIGDQPQNDLIPKLVRGLLDHRQRGRWLNTQENAFVLLALDRYFNTYERTTPDFAARVWLGDDYAGGHEFRGRTTERHEIEVPMAWLTQRGGTENLILAKDGPGRLYYRIGLRYAPADLDVAAAEHGFGVERVYEAVDDPGDVRREEDGTWVIRAGARVRVKLSMAAPARRYHVALVDPLPAGLEVLNPELAGQQLAVDAADDDREAQGRWSWWRWWRWYEHQNLRDERVEVFTSLLWPGVYDYSYLARATTPGKFVVPPPKAEEMYHPETFGRAPTDRVVVLE